MQVQSGQAKNEETLIPPYPTLDELPVSGWYGEGSQQHRLKRDHKGDPMTGNHEALQRLPFLMTSSIYPRAVAVHFTGMTFHLAGDILVNF